MRPVRAVGEAGLIERMRRRLHRDASVVAGIGDDAAVVRGPGSARWLFASDMLVENVHFRRSLVPPPRIGWKALACNVSDIAAMGGVPRWAVVSLGLPPHTPVAFVDGLYRGLERCARRFAMSVVGGDTVRAPVIVIDVAIIGVADRRHVTLRRGARVGDLLYVTGALGGSYRSGRHARFMPRLAEAQQLVRRFRIHAMMDLSDGLASDLWQMARASGVRLQVDAARIPVSRAAASVRHALTDGEDFELLFAVSPQEAERLPARLGRCPVTCIGRAVGRGAGVELVSSDGRIAPLTPAGFRHF